LFHGDNGVGKTMFMAYVLTQMIRRGNTAYYTTLAQLDVDIKRGFKVADAETRLDELLSSDFVAIDEIGKEHYRADSYLNTRLELLMKQRYDDGEPLLMGTNLDFRTLSDMYGASMTSMWEGKYQQVLLESGDFRRSIPARMRKDMGFDT
jgi:DNA replication protein DnaC